MTVNLEAKETDLPTVLLQIEHGDEVQLTKNGHTMARIVPHNDTPVFTPEQRARAQQALRNMDALRNELNLGPFNFEEFKADRDNGRR